LEQILSVYLSCRTWHLKSTPSGLDYGSVGHTGQNDQPAGPQQGTGIVLAAKNFHPKKKGCEPYEPYEPCEPWKG